MDYPLVSVIVPVYNGSDVIERAMNSVVRQDYPNIELIIIDDGSTDQSFKICKRYAERHQNVFVQSIRNAGVSNARNIGIKVSKGKYISFLDADDELMPNFISEGIKCIQETDVDIIGFNAMYIDGETIIPMSSFERRESVIQSKEEKDILIRQLYIETPGHFYGDYLRASWGRLYSAALLKNNKIEFPCNVPIGEDAVFLIYAFVLAKKICFRDEKLYKYYLSAESVTGRYTEQYYEKKLAEYNALQRALKDTKYIFKDIELVFWHRTHFEFIVNIMKSNMSSCKKIKLIRYFLKAYYPSKMLAIPMGGVKDKIRAGLLRKRCYFVVAMLEFLIAKRR